MPRAFLLEIGCEELPAGFIDPALAQLESTARASLAAARIAHGSLRALGTPRRLALLIADVADRQAEQIREVMGPATRVAFDAEGKPTNAARGFAKGAGVPVETLERIETPKGEYVLARVHDAGGAVVEVLPREVEAWIAALSFPKTMHWNGTGRFARPVRWIVALWGTDLLPVQAFGVASGRSSRGHRTIHPGAFEVSAADRYAEELEARGVVVDRESRRARVADCVAREAAAAGGRVIPDEDLAAEVANLVEWPEPVAGAFDASFLELPRPVVVTAMRAHQRYFAVESAEGMLLPRFVAVRNGRGEGADSIRRGTEMVLRARLEDARFYWRNDRKAGLEAKVEELRGIVWHEKLGTLYDRVERLERLSVELAGRLWPEARETVRRASRLCKADLATEMIRSGKEFATLEGIVGAEYAAAAGEPESVVQAIREHILPRGPSDPLPQTPAGTLLSLTDRLEAVAGGFRAGLAVSGSQDPYGLRRAANGVARILIEKRVRLDVLEIFDWLDRLFDPRVEEGPQAGSISDFWTQRVSSALEERGIPKLTAGAVLAVRPGDPLDALARAVAVEGIRQTADFEGLMICYRRAANLLRTAPPEDITVSNQPLAERAEAFADRAEGDLHLETKMARQAVETLLRAHAPDYAAVLGHLLALRPAIDGFFEAVMVMVDDTATRRRRLALLEAVRQTFIRIADFSTLQIATDQKSV